MFVSIDSSIDANASFCHPSSFFHPSGDSSIVLSRFSLLFFQCSLIVRRGVDEGEDEEDGEEEEANERAEDEVDTVILKRAQGIPREGERGEGVMMIAIISEKGEEKIREEEKGEDGNGPFRLLPVPQHERRGQGQGQQREGRGG